MLTEEQETAFVKTTGRIHDGETLEGTFKAHHPFNNIDWKYSPFICYFKYLPDFKLLCIEMSHRMTNSRLYTFNEDGVDTEDKRFIFNDSYIEEVDGVKIFHTSDSYFKLDDGYLKSLRNTHANS